MAESLAAPEARKRILARKAGPGWKVVGELNFSQEPSFDGTLLPEDLDVEVLNLSSPAERPRRLTLPRGLRTYELNLSNTAIERLPDDIQVECRLELSGCGQLQALPRGLKVGSLSLRGCSSVVELPEGLDVWFLDLTGCWAFRHWPKQATIRSGRLVLRGCTALTALPRYLNHLAAVNVRDCPNLRALPAGLEISGWLDIAQSGITEEASLPESLEKVQLRWAGINVDRRIAFQPESITAAEVLAEKNAERRRALMDRMGYRRFVSEAQAEVVDEDHDPGGARQLLRIGLEGDEDLVALSCHCPSTGRQYIIRVPPTTPTCRHAAAWIAGFDHPDDYQPILET